MKNLAESWDKLTASRDLKKIILFLDYDGTLAPIASSPPEAVLPPENKRLIERLSQDPLYQLVIISGRKLADLKQMMGLEGLIFIGNHGWEIEGPSMRFNSLIPCQVSSMMKKLKYELITQISDIQGAFIEDKEMTLSLHYRLVAPEKQFLVKRIFEHISQPYRRKNEIRMSTGKKVIELKPPMQWDKGKAALWLLRMQEVLHGQGRVLPVYIGDDNADEEAFEALKDKGVTVHVGYSEYSTAEYCLADPRDVTEFLRHIADQAYQKL